MAKRISPEEVVVNFFNTADKAKVETVFNIVKGIVKGRLSNGAKPTTKTTKPAATAAPATAAA